MKYVVSFVSEYGEVETTGIFKTEVEAIRKMNQYANERLTKARKHGVEYHIEPSDNPCKIKIFNHGFWFVNSLVNANDFD